MFAVIRFVSFFVVFKEFENVNEFPEISKIPTPSPALSPPLSHNTSRCPVAPSDPRGGGGADEVPSGAFLVVKGTAPKGGVSDPNLPLPQSLRREALKMLGGGRFFSRLSEGKSARTGGMGMPLPAPSEKGPDQASF